jgi:hypothetical protein
MQVIFGLAGRPAGILDLMPIWRFKIRERAVTGCEAAVLLFSIKKKDSGTNYYQDVRSMTPTRREVTFRWGLYFLSRHPWLQEMRDDPFVQTQSKSKYCMG